MEALNPITILEAVLAPVAVYFIIEYYKHSKIKKNIRYNKESFEISPGDKTNSVLILGIGGTGKTSLIKALLNNKDANPNEKTENFEMYRGSRQSEKILDAKEGKNSTVYWFYIADYRGQNIEQLVRELVKMRKNKFTSYITSLILVVDLLPPEKEYSSGGLKVDAPDRVRTQQHLNEWSDTALGAIFGLLTKDLKYINIFINKADSMSNRSQDAETEYIEIFQDIQEKIQARSNEAVVKTYLGSAKHGTGINHLVEDLIQHSE